jgi:hypothetical protein
MIKKRRIVVPLQLTQPLFRESRYFNSKFAYLLRLKGNVSKECEIDEQGEKKQVEG